MPVSRLPVRSSPYILYQNNANGTMELCITEGIGKIIFDVITVIVSGAFRWTFGP